MTLIDDLKLQRELIVKQVFESELTIVQQYLLGIIEGYERCIKLVEYYNVDEEKWNMSILKWLLVLTYILWVVVAISALLNPTVKSLIPLIVCSTSLIVAVVVVKDD